jgi:FtsX-like permease family
MLGLALATLRYRTGGFAASFVAVFFGATILMGFAALLDTAMGVTGESRKTLITIAGVVGGWGLILVVFAVASTLTLSVRQRGAEMALLKNVGATPAQIGRMIVGEMIVVTLAGAALASLPAAFAGRLLLTVLASTHQVRAGVTYRFGPAAVSMGLGITLAAATVAAILAAARITRLRAAESVVAASAGRARMSVAQIVFGGLLMAGGLGLGILTAASHGRGYKTMQTAGPACVLAAIGLALLGPVLIRAVTGVLAGPLERVTGVAGYLTVLNARQRTGQLATALMPIIVFTGIATGTLYMQSIENRATAAAGPRQVRGPEEHRYAEPRRGRHDRAIRLHHADQHAGRGDGIPQTWEWRPWSRPRSISSRPDCAAAAASRHLPWAITSAPTWPTSLASWPPASSTRRSAGVARGPWHKAADAAAALMDRKVQGKAVLEVSS